MRDNEVVFGIHRRLEVVADNSSAATTAVHGPGIRIGLGYLVIGRRFDLCGHFPQEPHLAAQACDLFPELFDPRLRNVAGLTIGTIERSKVTLDAGLNLLISWCALMVRFGETYWDTSPPRCAIACCLVCSYVLTFSSDLLAPSMARLCREDRTKAH